MREGLPGTLRVWRVQDFLFVQWTAARRSYWASDVLVKRHWEVISRSSDLWAAIGHEQSRKGEIHTVGSKILVASSIVVNTPSRSHQTAKQDFYIFRLTLWNVNRKIFIRTKVICLANHKLCRQSSEPNKTLSKFMKLVKFCFSFVEKEARFKANYF